MNEQEREHIEEFYKNYGIAEAEHYKFYDEWEERQKLQNQTYTRIEELNQFWYEYGTD